MSERVNTLAAVSVVSIACTLAACSVLTSLDGLSSGDLTSDGGTATASTADAASPNDASGGGGGGGLKPTPPPSSAEDGGGTRAPVSDDGGVLATDSSTPATDASAGGAPDASSGGTLDSGTGTVSGPDAAPGVDSAAPPPPAFCASLSPAPLFCDDFDEGAALATPWDQVTSLNGAVTLDGTFYTSPSKSMLSTVNASAPAGDVDLAGYKSLTAQQGVAGVYSAAFDIRIDAADTSSASDAVLGAIQLWNGSTAWDIEIELTYDATTNDFVVVLSEDGGGSYVTHAASQHLPFKAWARVAMAITLPAGSGGATPATLSFNGTQVVSATVHVLTTNPIPELVLGATYATPTAGGWAVRYDNVTFD